MPKEPKLSRLGGPRLTTAIAPEWALKDPDKYVNQIAKYGALWCAIWGGLVTFWCFGLGSIYAYRWGYAVCFKKATHEIENLLDHQAEAKQDAEDQALKVVDLEAQRALKAEKEKARQAAQEAKERARAERDADKVMKEDQLFKALRALEYSVAEATYGFRAAPKEGDIGVRMAAALKALGALKAG